MIEFRRMTLCERLKRLVPSYRRAHDERLRLAIQTLMDRPQDPCLIEGIFVEDGFGSARKG